MKKTVLLMALSLVLQATNAFSADLTLSVEGVRNNNGNLVMVVFKDKSAFNGARTDQAHSVVALKAAKGKQAVVLKDFALGKYAVIVLHDENTNENLDTNSRGFPLEGYAYSNNVGKMSVPTFKKAAFEITAEKSEVQDMKLIYIK